jgi:hypothetical protein
LHTTDGTENITPLLFKSLTLRKLTIEFYNIPLSFIATLTNLQELKLTLLRFADHLDEFNEIQNINFQHLKVLKFSYVIPEVETLVKFLEINGKTLTELCFEEETYDSLNLAIAKYCPNIQSVTTLFRAYELETLKIILNSCQDLKCIRIGCGGDLLEDKVFLDILAKYSPKYFCEAEIEYRWHDKPSKITPTDLEEFFTNWKNRVPQKSLSLTVEKRCNTISFVENVENIIVIEKYMKMGILKKIKYL